MNSTYPTHALRLIATLSIVIAAVSLGACTGRRRGAPGPAPTDGGGSGTDARVDGASGQICTLGEVRCRDTYNVEACAPGGDLVTLEWVNATTCYGGQVCVSGACVAGVDGGSGCPSVSAVAACESQANAMCERVVGCCVGGAAWCEPYYSFLSTQAECLSTLESTPEVSCASRASDPPRCTSDVAVCTSAYAALSCDTIGTAITAGTGGGLDLPPGC